VGNKARPVLQYIPESVPYLKHRFASVCVCSQAVEIDILKYSLDSSKTIAVKMLLATEDTFPFQFCAASSFQR